MTDQKTILAFDASTPTTVIVVGRFGSASDHAILEFDENDEFPNQTSNRIVGDIERVLERADLSLRDVDVFACGRGPGSFTGTRVALATAKGLALGLDRPIIPFSTLHAMVADAPEPDPHLALLPATRGDVFGCVFGSAGEPDEWCEPLAEISTVVDVPWPGVIVGPASVLGHPHFPSAWSAQSRPAPGPNAAGVWLATCATASAGAFQDAGSVHATYLRRTYAEMGINRPKRKAARNPILSDK